MEAERTAGFGWLAGWALVIVAADQGTKALVREHIPLLTSIHVIDGFFDLTHLQNRGAAFSFLANVDSGWINWGFGILAVAAIAVIARIFAGLEADDGLMRIAMILILGGAAGNLIDRAAIGSVTDFLDFYISGHHWPSFNVADSCISIGAFLIGLDWVLKTTKKSSE